MFRSLGALRYGSSLLNRGFSTSGPSKEVLLSIDWLFQGVLPNLMKQQAGSIFARMTSDVAFHDKIFGYEVHGVHDLNFHLMKVRAYFRYKSPFVKTEYVGATVYEGDDMITFLWKLSRLNSSFIRYFPEFVTGKKQDVITYEGALECYVNADGKIYKMINRPVTDADKEAAAEFSKLKEEVAKEEERKALREE
ncbi:unnamed protein product [Bursaphelenchus xylophilus]|uniref:(pine wood nematode) hypothetical protein n=1 Tax=Bursaphelenchus xylophilus TaxID=6326 RepID=A0A1I7S8W0_BURXY|nr:unnamed protein product [Bursaphelenchus xylophilus]CAG9085927.1 unnamed protein product [Bursaphelenchus xylophilus]